MPTPLIRARNKPRFGLPWLAIVLGVCTLAFGLVGWEAATAKPEAQLEIVVQGQHPWNISQETVDAVVTEPIKTMKPLRLLVTDRLLSFDEVLGRVDFGADVILSTAVAHAPEGTPRGNTRAGAGLSADLSKAEGGGAERNAVGSAYLDNAGLGHGPLAVAAAAQRAADVVDPGPIRTPAFWLAGTVLGMALTVISLSFSLSRRGRRERLFRRLSAAQHQMAGVVLGLEALEVTYRTTDQDRRTRGYTATWHAIRDDSLALARTEDAVAAAVHGRRSALKPATAVMVEHYESHARVLAGNADALLAAGSVLGRLDGSQGVLDRLAAPMILSTRELLARLAAAGPRAATPKQLRRLEKSLDGLLEVVGRDKAGTAQIEAWQKAETELQRSVTGILRSLRRRRAAQVSGSYKAREDVSSLRIGLGLSRTGSRLILSTWTRPLPQPKHSLAPRPACPWPAKSGLRRGRRQSGIHGPRGRTGASFGPPVAP